MNPWCGNIYALEWMERWKTGGAALILGSEEYDAQAGHKLDTPDTRAVEANITSGSPRISIVEVYPRPG